MFIAYFSWKWWNSIIEIYYNFNKIFCLFYILKQSRCLSLEFVLYYTIWIVKNSFEAVDRIRSIPPELFDEGYRYISFDVTSRFRNVPWNRTIKIILKRVYQEKLVKTNLKKKKREKVDKRLLF